MAGRGMGAASRGGGAVSSGPKNKMVSEPSKSTGKVLMMAKGGNVSQRKRMAMKNSAVRGKVQKFGGGGLLAPPGAPPPNPSVTKLAGAASQTIAKHMGPYLAVKNIPGVKELLVAKNMGKDLYQDYQNAMRDALNREAVDAQAYEQEMPTISPEPPNYRRGGAVRKKAKMMRKGGMSDKKGRAMKSKSKDSRGRAMRGY